MFGLFCITLSALQLQHLRDYYCCTKASFATVCLFCSCHFHQDVCSSSYPLWPDHFSPLPQQCEKTARVPDLGQDSYWRWCLRSLYPSIKVVSWLCVHTGRSASECAKVWAADFEGFPIPWHTLKKEQPFPTMGCFRSAGKLAGGLQWVEGTNIAPLCAAGKLGRHTLQWGYWYLLQNCSLDQSQIVAFHVSAET